MYTNLSEFFSNNWPDMLALVSGTIGVWLTIKENILCWPAALLSVLISLVIFFKQRLYGDMSLQVVYFFAGIYGWRYWNQNRQKEFVVTNLPKRLIPLLLAVTMAQAVIYYYLLIYFGGDRPVLDAALTAGSLTATYMMTKKWVANWMVWVAIDGTYILLYGLKEMWWFALLYLLFTIMAYYGWLKWCKAAV